MEEGYIDLTKTDEVAEPKAEQQQEEETIARIDCLFDFDVFPDFEDKDPFW